MSQGLAPQRQGVALDTRSAQDGTVVVREYKIDASKLATPSRTMAANWATARRSGNQIEFLFAQTGFDSSRLVAGLIVSMAAKQVASAFFNQNPTFVPALNEMLAGQGMEPQRCPPSDGPERVVLERASIIAMSYTGDDADIRFYRVSPHQIVARTTQNIVDPVVQIVLAPQLLAGLAAELQPLVADNI